MEFNLVPEPTLSPTCCFICRSGHGPYVWVRGMTIAGVQTAEGPKDFRGGVYICVGNERNSGCLPQMVELAGGLGPAEAERQRRRLEVLGVEAEEYQARILALERKLEDAQPRVVRVDELPDLIGRSGLR